MPESNVIDEGRGYLGWWPWWPPAAHPAPCVAPKQQGSGFGGFSFGERRSTRHSSPPPEPADTSVIWILILGSSWSVSWLRYGSNSYPKRGWLFGDFLGSRTPSTSAAEWAGNTSIIMTLGGSVHSHVCHSFLVPNQWVWGSKNSGGDVSIGHMGMLEDHLFPGWHFCTPDPTLIFRVDSYKILKLPAGALWDKAIPSTWSKAIS